MENPLDNPVWHALSETHARFALDYGVLKCYDPAYAPFGAWAARREGMTRNLAEYAALTDNFFVVGRKPPFSPPLQLDRELVCAQMVVADRIDAAIGENVVPLGEAHYEALFQLVDLVQPGYFRRQTALLGHYYGIFQNARLVAAAGERMQMRGFTEVSAVVTHPQHTGKGYASQLVAHTVNRIFDRNNIPFLHVAETNGAAIRIYEKLGFSVRRKMSFWNFVG